jgi:hypothetical protein
MLAASSYKRLYGTAQWKRVRRLVLARSGGRCELTPGCPRPASTVDHMTPVLELAMTGRLAEFYDPLLLRAACQRCNASHGASFGNRQRRHRRRMTAMEAALAWAERENAYWAERERQAAAAVQPQPRIY